MTPATGAARAGEAAPAPADRETVAAKPGARGRVLPRVAAPIQAPGRVLSTLNEDGTRRWIRPRPSPGRFERRRRTLAWALIALFVALPYLRVAGKPAVLLDLPRREFTLFGGTFLATDTLLFMLLFLGIAIAVFLVTALFGRVWCGWACPQTVYLEFVFRPLERWIEGGVRGSLGIDAGTRGPGRRLVTWLVYLPIAAILAHVFLAYFVGVERLWQWMHRSPVEHPVTFLIMLGTTALVYLDFAWFREQTCLVACPYGRLQTVLLDRQSLIVGYDARRGEPRGRGIRPAGQGDCVDCHLCVQTCPTGIDIRDGLQMECIHCTQCMDACDAVMTRIGKPRGLIRYTSGAELAGAARRLLRPRVVLYPIALAVTLGLFGAALAMRTDTDVTLLRGAGAPFERAGDEVLNRVRVKLVNRTDRPRRYRIELAGAPAARLVAPMNPFPVPARGVRTTSVFVAMPAAAFEDGGHAATFRVSDAAGSFRVDVPWVLVGPADEAEEDHDSEEEER